MKFNKIGAALLAGLTLSLASCSEGQYWDEPTAASPEVSFPKAAATVNLLADDVFDSYDVIVTRSSSAAAESVELTATTTAEDVFTTIPAVANFEAGATSTTVTIGVNTSAMSIGKVYSLVLAAPASEEEHPEGSIASPAANEKFTFKISKNFTWQNIGWMLYTDGFVSTFYGVDDLTYYVPVQTPVQAEGAGVYRLVNAYGEYYPYNEPGDYSGTSYLEINASNPAQVYIPTPQESNMNWGEGNFIFGSVAGLRLNQGWSDEKIAEAGLWGTLEDGIITFPVNSLIIGMADYNDGGLYASNRGGGFCLDISSLTTENPYE